MMAYTVRYKFCLYTSNGVADSASARIDVSVMGKIVHRLLWEVNTVNLKHLRWTSPVSASLFLASDRLTFRATFANNV